jgi:septal ring factor EnvC (AmiA/AmiB activator)
MNDATTRFVLQVLAVLLGGGSVQLILRLAFKKSDLRRTNTESDSVVVTAANNQVVRLEAELARAFAEVEKVRSELSSERSSRSAQITEVQRVNTQLGVEAQARSNEMVEEFRKENERLNRVIVKLQIDLSKANAKISVLEGK